ncbi:Uncharacterised protein [Mycobacteroides abscessus subsp. abscessus]|nr:Uncharacterised protein [Mycobacteroides abscessus subsp. abscessus]
MLGGGNGRRQQHDGIGAKCRQVVNPRARGQPEPLDSVFGRNQQCRGPVRNLACDSGSQHATVDKRAQAGHLLQRGICSGALVNADARIGSDLLGKPPVGYRGKCSLVASECEVLVIFTGQIPLAGNKFRSAKLGDFLIAVALVPALTAGPGVRRTVCFASAEGAQNRELTHLLHATGDNEIGGTTHHGLGGEVHCLLGGSALTVNGYAGN